MSVVNLDAKFAKFADQWSPKIVAQLAAILAGILRGSRTKVRCLAISG